MNDDDDDQDARHTGEGLTRRFGTADVTRLISAAWCLFLRRERQPHRHRAQARCPRTNRRHMVSRMSARLRAVPRVIIIGKAIATQVHARSLA